MSRKLPAAFRWPLTAVVLFFVKNLSLGFYISYKELTKIPKNVIQDETFELYLKMALELGKTFFALIIAFFADSFIGKFIPMSVSFTSITLIWPVYLFLTFNIIKIVYFIALGIETLSWFGYVLYFPFISEQFDMELETLQRYYTYDFAFLMFCTEIFKIAMKKIQNIYLGEKFILIGPFLSSIGFSIVFIVMKKKYRKYEPKNTTFRNIGCLLYATGKRMISCQKMDFFDFCGDKFDDETIQETKRMTWVMAFIGIFLVYNSVYCVMEEKMFEQATQLNRALGSWTISLEEIRFLIPLFIVLMTPLIEHLIFSSTDEFEVLKTSMEKVCLSYVLFVFVFILAAVIQFYVEKNNDYFTTKPYVGQVRLTNCYTKPVLVSFMEKTFTIKALQQYVFNEIDADGDFKSIIMADVRGNVTLIRTEIDIMINRCVTYLLVNNDAIKLVPELEITKDTERNPIIILFCSFACDKKIELMQNEKTWILEPPGEGLSIRVTLDSDKAYSITYENKKMENLFTNVHYGAVYAYMIYEKDELIKIKKFIYYDPFLVHIMWMVPQYVLLACAKVILYVGSGLFLYTESPVSMRCFLRAVFEIVVAVLECSKYFSRFLPGPSLWIFVVTASILLVLSFLQIYFTKKYEYQIHE